ncbi:MAG: FAD-linked oxidase C-terminal domain-containing protein [Polyangiaceae bacterium]
MFRRSEPRRLDARAVDVVRARLDRALGTSKILTDEGALLGFASDESENEPIMPDVVVRAENAADCAKVLEIASELAVPVTPRAGGSGKSGGCIPAAGGIVLATLGLNGIKEIDRRELLAVVEPGVILGELHAAVEAEGLFYPPDANSLESCALGGNVAENAAGPRAFKYGSTRDYVLGLEVLTIGGAPLRVGRRTKKGVTGYDLAGLLVGSEGTLALTTEITVRLVPKPEHIVTLMALFADVHAAGRAVAEILAARVVPRCIELLDRATLEAVRARGLALDPTAQAMLVIEVDGAEPTTMLEAERVGEAADRAGAISVLVAQDEAQRDRLWAARRALSRTTRAMAKYKVSEDVVVPRSRIGALLDEIDRIRAETGIMMLSYGHAGDGNLHVNFLWNDPSEQPAVERGLGMLFRAVVAERGTLTGEHGVGLSKRDYLPIEQSSAVIDLQRQLKAVFDPHDLLNPGKIFPRPGGGHASC